MTRLIDADALKYEPLPKGERNYRTYNLDDAYEDGYNDAFVDVGNAPTVDAVPSETLYDFIRGIGAITYGKERFFHEEIGLHCGLWYDRKSCEWITTQTAIEECLKAVRELDDY